MVLACLNKFVSLCFFSCDYCFCKTDMSPEKFSHPTAFPHGLTESQ